MKSGYLLFVLFFFIALGTALSQENIIVEMKDIYPDEMYVSGFRLDSEQDVRVEAAGIHKKDRRHEYILGTCWIIDSQSRKLVWSFEPDHWSRRIDIQRIEDELRLPAGTYEVYFSSYPYSYWNSDWHWRHHRNGFFSNLFRWIFHGDWYEDEYRYDRDLYREFQVIVRGTGHSLTKQTVLDNIAQIRDNAALNLFASEDNLYLDQGFALSEELELEVYAIGEARRDGEYDYGWIINSDTRERVWQFKFENSDEAGGAYKNCMVKKSIRLPEGRYAVVYVTDDSHSPGNWNAAPPYDPYFYGLTLTLTEESASGRIRKYDYQRFDTDKKILSLVSLRDDDFASEGIQLKKDMAVRVYAVGEGREDEMFDYGWIVDANDGHTMWQMEFYKTNHAGGARKNRLIDDIIELEAGNYIVYFVTDGSHSYRDWNASPPFDQKLWGISLYAADQEYNSGDVTAYDPQEDPSILAKIVRVRDHDYKRTTFTLEKDGPVRIYALGEGIRGDMYDYAWIEESESGKVVWEMTYRKTEHAGGARKNRMYNDTVYLKAGEYTVFYESDDSHSYNDWNDSPPYDPLNYGITVYAVK